MSLTDVERYRIETPEERFVDSTGVEEWTLRYLVPDGTLAGARSHFKSSLTNILPGHNATDVYAPVVHHFDTVPSETKKHQEVRVILRRPTDAMILQPGRGLLSLTTYEVLRTEEVAILEKRTAAAALDEDGNPKTLVSQRYVLKRERQHIVDVRTVLVATVVDLAATQATINARAKSWAGKRGTFTVAGKKYENLKLMRVEITPRASNVRWLDSRWFFAQRDDEWPEAGVIEEEWYAVSLPSETEIAGFDPDAGTPTLAEDDTGYLALKLHNEDNDVISGDADFAAIANYFSWLSR